MILQNIKYCHEAIRNGLDLFPVQSDKRPAFGLKWTEECSPEQRLERLHEGVWGVGIPCKSNLLCMDFDADADVLFPAFLEKLWSERRDLVHRFWVEKTPHGYHMIFRVDGQAPGNTKLARRNGDPTRWSEKHGRYESAIEVVVQIETRGDGGYFVTFPSPGYVWLTFPVEGEAPLSATEIWKLEPITEADVEWLFDMARSFDTYVPPVRHREVKPLDPERLAARNRQRYREMKEGSFVCDPRILYGSGCTLERYIELLKDHDWQIGHTDENGRVWVWRPGIPCDPGNYSGNLYEKDGCWLLYIFTTNSELPANCGLTAWQFLMFEQGYTTAEYPQEITWDEYATWRDAWYEDQAKSFEPLWEPMVEKLEREQKFNCRRYV